MGKRTGHGQRARREREQPETAWIVTELADDADHYVVGLYLGKRRLAQLDPDTAAAHARHVLEATIEAEHVASAWIALRRLPVGFSDTELSRFLGRARGTYPPYAPAPTPLSVEPGVSIERKPFLLVQLEGKAVGQWSAADARSHVSGVLGATRNADLDTFLRDFLVERTDLDGTDAGAFITSMGSVKL